MVGVTVDTAILAGIIEAEINACHAAAFQALVFVFDCIDRTAKQSGNEFSINTVGMCNLPAGQIDVFGAGVYFQPAGMSRRSKRFCDASFCTEDSSWRFSFFAAPVIFLYRSMKLMVTLSVWRHSLRAI